MQVMPYSITDPNRAVNEHIQAFIALADLTQPKTPVRDNKYPDGGY